MRERGVPPLAIPANYYDDLAARSELDAEPDRGAARRSASSTTATRGGELLHFYTPIVGGRLFFEVVAAPRRLRRLRRRQRAGPHGRTAGAGGSPQSTDRGGDRDHHAPRRRTRKTPRKAALASWIGSVLEYYDFFIYGTAAALVFGKVFFPESDPATATLLSFATYGVGYVARPIGAFFMGHIGDRYGRKRVLVLTCDDGHGDVPRRLPADLRRHRASGRRSLLVVLRLMQGFSASGEQAGANSLTLEHAPDRPARVLLELHAQRHAGRASSSRPPSWLPIGALPDDQLLTWGWRIPFWLSAIVVARGRA